MEEGIRLGVEDVVRIAAARQAYGCAKPRFEAWHLARDLWEIFGLEQPAEGGSGSGTGDEDEAIKALEVEVAYAQAACLALQSQASICCTWYTTSAYCGNCSSCRKSLQGAEQ